ncbi:hypothetical protein [Thetidibacter halocola]|uniref:5-bromo-4-chloroindolyl phosphate hydrolase n=1 Tax=Thetidibacter halocola TaxID=2827239 RepID=A0A8J7WDH3_9RHOB|nr:hypothetical protein [Thetidibacter halocola]MBS0125587.1 hypothetical protein [Thetidibacter halocola]
MRHQRDNHDRREQGVEAGLGVLFLAAFPLVLWLFQGSAVALLSALVEFMLLALALRLIAQGQAVTRAYDAARVAYRPKLPRKLMGSTLIGLVVLILAGHQFPTLLWPLACGLMAFLLSVLAFGIDPMKDKGLDDPAELQRLQHKALITEVETTLAEVVSRVAGLNDADLTRRSRAATETVLRLMRASAQEPAQLDQLRKPLTTVTRILGEEVMRLESDWEGAQQPFARRRYVAKLSLLVEKFQDLAFRGGVRVGRDAFDMEADLLLERMRGDSAA